ncbi:hypothetical protein J5Y09_08615 [Roseomonas sp. PWR1]|uniref:Glycosyltransferase RgtA/B/C/D-like domain-containing protein n=1 Tax=Roseomonas nitratireducens TaxID=2820810 RepID=A0ABS4ARL0_9PROT|nr:DUF6311 domain-containing protein [Neoroseomonas nitratireducens]MBP0463971.1 hypothetical protein [Neoroseomonas nitratireducens]
MIVAAQQTRTCPGVRPAAKPPAVVPRIQPLSPRLAAALSYGFALLLGAGLALALFPAEMLVPRAGGAFAPQGDAAQHAIAQRYFLADDWRWPLLTAANLRPPEGVNIAFVDGIPLLALLLKAAFPLLPEGFHGIGLWYAIAWTLQPVAAVWALRGAGETRLLPAIGVALAASAMPSFVNRYGHAALTGHFCLLLALGAYARLVRGGGVAGWAGAAGLAVGTLLVHPYLAAMALALLAAVPTTLLLRGDRRWIGAAGGLVATVAAVFGTMAMLGYLGATGDGGYGDFALNLLSPVWPYRSLVLGWLVEREVDATGHGGWEGYNWLGLGLLAGLVLLVAAAPRAVGSALRRHAGLALALAGLTLLALSFRVGAGGAVLVDLGDPPGFLEQFRASGRFFWPVGLALLVGAAALLARLPRFGPVAVLALGLLQFADAAPNRAALAAWAGQRQPWTVEATPLRALLAEARSVAIFPTWPCVPKPDTLGDHGRQLQVLNLAAERGVTANTMYVARWRGERPRCDDAAAIAAPLAPGELRIVLPGARDQALASMPGAAALCAPLGEVLACRLGR